jgi:hypothetical protein
MPTMRADSESAGNGDWIVVAKVGAAGGDVTLLGRKGPDAAWKFKRVTEDQTEMLFGEAETSMHVESEWVDGWEAALRLMDRYPWAMLHALEVHVDFSERVRVAVEGRLTKQEPSRHVKRALERWERVLGGLAR